MGLIGRGDDERYSEEDGVGDDLGDCRVDEMGFDKVFIVGVWNEVV